MFNEVRNGNTSSFSQHAITFNDWKNARDTWEGYSNNHSWRFGHYEGQFVHAVYRNGVWTQGEEAILVAALKVFVAIDGGGSHGGE